MNRFEYKMDEECRTDVDQETLPSTSAASTLLTDVPSEAELPKIMASLGLDENAAPSLKGDSSPSCSGSLKLRRSQRKQAVPRIAVGGVTKRRCTLKQQARRDLCLHESDDEIREFYENYNKNFKRQETKSLETIYEDPKDKNGTVVLSGFKQKRFLAFNDFVSKAKLRKRQSKIKLLLLETGTKPERKRFTIDDVKEHLAQSGLVNLPAQ